jgi:hypothetical protein
MKKLTQLFLLFTCLAITPLVAQEEREEGEQKNWMLRSDQLALKAALGFHASYLKSAGKRISLPGFMLAPSISHSLGNMFELSIQGLLRLGKKQDLSFMIDNIELGGRAAAYDVQITPQIKAYLPFPALREGRWRPYISVGPSWSLYTFSFRNNESARNSSIGLNSSQFKLAYDTNGFSATLGFQEITKYKEMHPTFIEIIYSSYQSRRVSLLDTTKFHKTNTILERGDRSLKGQMIAINIGVTLF